MFQATHLHGFNAFSAASAATGIIHSIQPFEITIGTSATSNTATITSVDTSKSVIFFGGFTTTHNGNTYREFFPRVELTNGTTVTAYRDTSSASQTVTVRGTVVEFESAAVTSVQAGTINMASSSASGTATISAVTTSRAAVFYLGNTNTTSTTSPQSVLVRTDLTNSTTVTATRATANTAVLTVGYCVVEFAASVVSSVQQRSVTLSTSSTSSSDTISSVNTGRTLLLYNGSTSSTSTLSNFLYNLELTAATTVTLIRTGTSTTSRTINYTAVEFATGIVNSLQRDTTAISAATSADAAVSSVNTSKTLCNWTGFSSDGGSTDARFATAKLLNATTVRCEKNTSGGTDSTPGWEVVEFV